MTSPQVAMWDALVQETMNASELIQSGLNRLSRVNVDEVLGIQPYKWITPLHLGLADFTSGLERLAKITICLSGQSRGGSFAEVRRYGHDIARLLRQLETIELPEESQAKLPDRPEIPPEEELIDLLTKFANNWRYENIDFIATQKKNPQLYHDWCKIATDESVPDFVEHLIALRHAAEEGLNRAITQTDSGFPFDLALSGWLDAENESPVFAPSSSVALQIQRLSKWVADVQATLVSELRSSRPQLNIPYLEEATVYLRTPPADFFAFTVMRFGDYEMLAEELEAWFKKTDGFR